MQTLLTLPPRIARYLNDNPIGEHWKQRLAGDGTDAFLSSDPPGQRLGSGGGTVHLIWEAWQQTAAKGQSLAHWLTEGQRLILHAGGQSRRLPAYAPQGKLFLPIPLLPGLKCQRFDQTLADFQLPLYREVLQEAGPQAAALITAGDVWLDFDPTDVCTMQRDLTGIGMQVPPEVARHFGVFFVHRSQSRNGGEQPIAFFLQKPTPEVIQRYAAEYDYYVDTGMWLLSTQAVETLFRRCGWQPQKANFKGRDAVPSHLDLYDEVGTALGNSEEMTPALRRAGFDKLSASVVPLREARFLHLGSNRQVLESLERLQSERPLARRHFLTYTAASHFHSSSKEPVFADGCLQGKPPLCGGHNIITQLPARATLCSIPERVCVDCPPVEKAKIALRVYHLDDPFRGPSNKPDTLFCGQPMPQWLQQRGAADLCQDTDIQQLPLFPVLAPEALDQKWLDWFVSREPDPVLSAQWRDMKRLAASDIPDQEDFDQFFRHRQLALEADIESYFTALATGEGPVEADHDFEALAKLVLQMKPRQRKAISQHTEAAIKRTQAPTVRARLQLFHARLAQSRTQQQQSTEEGFQTLRDAIIAGNAITPSTPTRSLKEDQIVWARSPIRLDLAGGWTDTPPFCLEEGGAVLNLACNLNGQPPIQVYVRPTSEPTLKIHSIDLGLSETVTSWEQVESFRDPRSGFSLPKAALALAGFHPDFYGDTSPASLTRQLERFGSGLEVSLLCAIPKGSGLGTSSILAATLLGALGRACGLGWDDVDIYRRVLAMEQLLTTGGGWQDQAGALFPSLKLIQTSPGPDQAPIVRYLPRRSLQSDGSANAPQMLLYYTGITRLAKNILEDIVEGMFLRRAEGQQTLHAIRRNADKLFHAVQLDDTEAILRCIRRSWQLNKKLDPGTSTPEIEGLLALVEKDVAACKLLGAGGGGYLVLFARNREAAQRIRTTLEKHQPNPRARFVEPSLSETGLQVTVS